MIEIETAPEQAVEPRPAKSTRVSPARPSNLRPPTPASQADRTWNSRRLTRWLWLPLTAALLPFSFLALASHDVGHAVITEFVANNRTSLLDEDDESSDWIEIHNTSSRNLKLNGWYLTDDPFDPMKWRFPNVDIPEFGFLVVFASGKNRTAPTGNLHTNFSLDAAGEYLALIRPNGITIESEFKFPEQNQDIAFGSSGIQHFVAKYDTSVALSNGYLEKPSPGTFNSKAVVGFVTPPEFSVTRGFFDQPFDVEINTPTPGALIRYTLDGTPPSPTVGTLYDGPIRVSNTSTIRAIALKDGYASTAISTQSYIFAADIKRQTDMDADIVDASAYGPVIQSSLSNTLPTMCLVVSDTEFFGPSGIHTDPEECGREMEIPVSVEYFDAADRAQQFQLNAGLRIHGGASRSHPKKSLRLYFRQQYGSRRLQFPLFEDSSVGSFDQLTLRSGGQDSFSPVAEYGHDPIIDLPPHGTMMRDQFLRKTAIELGLLSPHGKYVHLYINGRYWGVYDLHERPNAAFFQSHLGGLESDYDVLHHPTYSEDTHTIVDGHDDAWQSARKILSGNLITESDYAEIQNYLDLDSYIDHLILRMWSGVYDWCGPVLHGAENATAFDNQNWYVGRKSRNGEGTFRFLCWDSEISMGNHLLYNVNSTNPVPQQVTDLDLTTASDSGSPLEFYDVLRHIPKFQMRFADRLQKHFHRQGAMTVSNNRRRWNALANELREAMIAETARWGDEGGPDVRPFTRDDNWLPEVDWVRQTFMGGRNDILLAQFRSRGLFPTIDAPTFCQPGGSIATGFQLTMSARDSTIYYTVDGTDPYDPPDVRTMTLIDESADAVALVPSPLNGGDSLGDSWTTSPPPDNNAAWKRGKSGIGHETTDGDCESLIHLELPDDDTANTSVFIRLSFVVGDEVGIATLDTLTLSMKYADGFVAYLNGKPIASANAPAHATWNSAATASRSDTHATAFEDFDIFQFRHLLVAGQNTLAIHAFSAVEDSTNLLIVPRLTARQIVSKGGVTPAAIKYTGGFPLNSSVQIRARAVNKEWSALNKATFVVGTHATTDELTNTHTQSRQQSLDAPSHGLSTALR